MNIEKNLNEMWKKIDENRKGIQKKFNLGEKHGFKKRKCGLILWNVKVVVRKWKGIHFFYEIWNWKSAIISLKNSIFFVLKCCIPWFAVGPQVTG